MRDGGNRTPVQKGRGASLNPGNRFEGLERPWEPEWLEHERCSGEEGWRAATRIHEDTSRGVLTRNDSPDVGFTWSLNPYRGCEHGCSYCYARPSHEFLGFSAGLDFETNILVKRDAPELLEQKLASRGWVAEPVLLSGNTDCYQPVERRLEITRGCLEVFLRHRHPVWLITKNAMVLRDLDLLRTLAGQGLAAVTISVTTLDARLSAALEPRASTPARRLEAIAALSGAGVPVRVNTAPLIPGLNDHEVPAILEAAANHGARAAGYIMLRLPHGVKELFTDWLERHAPERRDKVLGAVRQVRGGKLSDPRFGSRMRGEGPRADLIAQLFHATCRRLNLDTEHPPLRGDLFTPPAMARRAKSARGAPDGEKAAPAQGDLFRGHKP